MIRTAPLLAQVVKLADIHSNLSAIARQASAGQSFNRSYAAKAARFLEALEKKLGATSVFTFCLDLLGSLED